MMLAEVRDELLEQLPHWIEQDPALRQALRRMLREDFADREQTESRFDQVLAELRRDREEQTRKWEEDKLRWEENKRDSERRWEENKREFDRVHQEIMATNRRLDQSIGALGARWGLSSERAFRDALASILEKSFGVEVRNINEFDQDGEVFGRPDQVELDVVIRNGSLLIIEIKSSFSHSDVHIFERKARFFERHHQRRADRLIIVSPMVDHRARHLAEALGIEVCTSPEDVR